MKIHRCNKCKDIILDIQDPVVCRTYDKDGNLKYATCKTCACKTIPKEDNMRNYKNKLLETYKTKLGEQNEKRS